MNLPPWFNISYPLALQVRKTLDKTYTFRMVGMRHDVMSWYYPYNPKSQLQQAWRAVFQEAVQSWQYLPASDKNYYNKSKYPAHMSGYNRYLRYYLNQFDLTMRSFPISIDSIREGAAALSPFSTPSMVTFLGVIHYIEWPAANEDVLNTSGLMIPADIKPGTAFKINVWIQKGGASNEYFKLACGGANSSGVSAAFIPSIEQLIPAVGNVKLTFTASTDLDKIEPGGYFYIYFQHGPTSANSNTVFLLAIEFEYIAVK